MHMPTLFLVEDEPDTAALVTMIMRAEGYEVLHASDGKQAQVQVDALPPPALVLLDIGLPNVNGLELLAQMRRKSTWSAVPIVMLTAAADQTQICKAVVAGASAYILKPFKRDTLIAKLEPFRAPGMKRKAS